MILDLANTVGLVGSAIMVGAYAYSNFARAIDFLLFNLSLEIVWALIAAAGLTRALMRRRA